jgi:hypothetical protein
MINPRRKISSQTDNGENLQEYNPDIIRGTQEDNLEEVEAALEKNPDCIYQCDPKGMNALHWAGATGNVRIATVLFAAKNSDKIREAKDIFGREPMKLAIESGNDALAELYFQNIFPEVYEQDAPYNLEKKIIPFTPTDSEP